MVETGGAELQKAEMSGPSSLESSMVSSVQRLILMDLHPPSSCLTFDLDEGWSFMEPEDWRPDIAGSWLPCGADDSESFILSHQSLCRTHATQAVGYIQTAPGSIQDPYRWKSGNSHRWHDSKEEVDQQDLLYGISYCRQGLRV